MAKENRLRSVNTHFWDDSYVVNLDPIEKLLFLYFLTNPLTNLAGVYEIALRRIAFDTGIDKAMVEKILDRFERDKKIYYREGYIILVNFQKNQNYNDSMITNVKNTLKTLPQSVFCFFDSVLEGVDRVGTSHRQVEGKGKDKSETKVEGKGKDETLPLTDYHLPDFQIYLPEDYNNEIQLNTKIRLVLKNLCNGAGNSEIKRYFNIITNTDGCSKKTAYEFFLVNCIQYKSLKEEQQNHAYLSARLEGQIQDALSDAYAKRENGSNQIQ